jgi:hypothetical protein
LIEKIKISLKKKLAEFGLFLDTTESGSGTAAGDRNGSVLTFSSVEREDFLVVSASVAANLEVAGTS